MSVVAAAAEVVHNAAGGAYDDARAACDYY